MGLRANMPKKNPALLTTLSQSLHGQGGFSKSFGYGVRAKKTSLSKSLHGKISLPSKKRNYSEAKNSYAVVSQSTKNDEDFEDNRLEWEDAALSLDFPEAESSTCTMPLSSMLSGFCIDNITDRNAKEGPDVDTVDPLPTETNEPNCEKNEKQNKRNNEQAPFSPASVAELLQVEKNPPNTDAAAEDATSLNKAEKRKDHDLSGSLHGKLLGSSKRVATSLSKTIHGSLPVVSLSKTAGLSKSLHGRILRRSIVGIDDTLPAAFSACNVDFPLKSCLKSIANGESDEEAQVKNVSFSVVNTRKYAPDVSINPMVRDGLAISLSWEYTCCDEESVDVFESQRELRVSKEREMVMDYVERLRILRTAEIPMKEMKRCIDASRKARNLRMQTVREIRAEDRKCEALVKKLSKKSMKDFE